jgi:hypothetical protein
VRVAALLVSATNDPGAGGLFNIGLADTHGISVWSFNLALNVGNRLNPGDTAMLLWSSLMQAWWENYRLVMATMIWMLDWVLSMEWVDWLMTPLRGFSRIMRICMDTVGLMPLMLAILAAIVTYWLLRGRYAGGIVELLIGVSIAALATGALADPMEVIAGPEGLIFQSRDAGWDIATAIATDGRVMAGDQETMRKGTSAALVDTLIRAPHQLLNYGQILDGGPCEKAYDAAVGKDDARDQVGNCDPALKAWADNPDAQKAMSVAMLAPSAYFFGAFALALVTLVVVAVLGAGWSAVKLIPQLVLGVVSGGARAGLFKTFANVAFAMCMVALSTIFCVAWMKMLLAFFGATGSVPWIIRIVLLDLMLIVGVVAAFILRRKVKKSLHRVAARLAALGPNPSKPADPAKMPDAARFAAKEAARAWLRRSRSSSPLPRQVAARPAPVDIGHLWPQSSPAGGGRRALPPGPNRPPADPSGSQGPNSIAPTGGAGAGRLLQRVGKGVELAAHGAALFATGGTSAAVTGAKVASAAAKTAKVAKAVRMANTLANAAKGARASAVPRTGPTAGSTAPAGSAPQMRRTGRRLAEDRATGTTYRRSTVPASSGTGRVEVLQPMRPPAPGDDLAAALRLRSRLKTRARK